jgi:hypothetical protein
MLLRNDLQPISISGDLRRGGWLMTGQADGDTDAASANLNVVLSGKSLSDYIDPDWRSAFNFHVLANPDFTFDRFSSRAQWQAGTVDNFLKVRLQAMSLADVASPANSHEATSWNFGLAVDHILKHHCNAVYDPTGAAGSPDGRVTTLNIDTTNSTEFELFIIRSNNSLWSALQAIGGGEGGGEFYVIFCKRDNSINYQSHPAFVSPLPASKGTLTKDHIRGTVRVQFHNSQPGEKISQVQLATFANRTITYNASYPANPSGEGEIFELKRGVWASSQARADNLAERLYKWKTRLYTIQVEVDPGLVLFGDDGQGIDLADRIALTYDGPAEDTATGAGVHLDLDAVTFFVYGVDIRLDPAQGRATATLTLEHGNI